MREDDCGADVAKDSRIDNLFVAARARERDEDRREADEGQLRDCACAGAADDQVCGGVQIGEFVAHVLEDAVAVVETIW